MAREEYLVAIYFFEQISLTLLLADCGRCGVLLQRPSVGITADECSEGADLDPQTWFGRVDGGAPPVAKGWDHLQLKASF